MSLLELSVRFVISPLLQILPRSHKKFLWLNQLMRKQQEEKSVSPPPPLTHTHTHTYSVVKLFMSHGPQEYLPAVNYFSIAVYETRKHVYVEKRKKKRKREKGLLK